MKGLRPSAKPYIKQTQPRLFLPCDLNEGITTKSIDATPDQAPTKFLPCDLNEGITTWAGVGIIRRPPEFLPCDLNEGITTRASRILQTVSMRVFTLWPEWRDYDPLFWLPSNYTWHIVFLPCDLNEGITTLLTA